MATVTIRKLAPDDHLKAVAAAERWWDPPLRRPPNALLQRLFFDHFNDTSFVAEDAGQFVGFLIGFLSQSRPNDAYIHFVGVDPNFRGRGVARSLYIHFFDIVSALSQTRVSCITSPRNELSTRFHHALGFDAVPGDAEENDLPVHADHGGAGVPMVLFQKTLPSDAATLPATPAGV